MIRMLVVHKVRLTCDLLAAALNEEAEVEVVDFARDAEETLAKLAENSYDVALVNINLPDDDVLKILRKVARGGMPVKVVLTGLVQSNTAILRYIEEGAAGYVLEEESLAELMKKIRAVAEQKFSVTPRVAGALIARLGELKRQVRTIRMLTVNEACQESSRLTAREWEILGLIERGLTNRQIAAKLVIELGTVKNHVHNILRKLDVQNRKHAVIFARQSLIEESSAHSTFSQPRVS